MVSKSEKLGTYGRRSFIAALTSLGLSKSVAASLSQEQLQRHTDDPGREVPVPTAHIHQNHEAVKNGEPPERTSIFTTVSRDIWEQNRAAHLAARRLSNRFGTIDGVRAGVVDHGGDPTAEVEYRTGLLRSPERNPTQDLSTQGNSSSENDPAPDDIAGQLPSNVTETVGQGQNTSDHRVEVQFVHREIDSRTEQNDVSPAQDGEAHFDSYYGDIPSGCHILTERRHEYPYAKSTTCTPAYYTAPYHSEPVIVTAGHAFTGSGQENGKNAWQPTRDSSNYFGTCGQAKWDNHPDTRFDGAYSWVSENGRGISYTIANDSGGHRSGEITGTVAWQALEQGNVVDLNKQGCATGFDVAKLVTKTYPRSNFAYRNIKINAQGQPGDSGGPLFDTRNSGETDQPLDHLIAGIVYNGDQSISEATYIGEIEREFGLTV